MGRTVRPLAWGALLALLLGVAPATADSPAQDGPKPPAPQAGSFASRLEAAAAVEEAGRLREADDAYATLAEEARRGADLAGEAEALLGRFRCLEQRQDYMVLLQVTQRLLEVQRRAGDRAGATATLGDLGAIHARLGDYARAYENIERALGEARALGDASTVAFFQSNLSLLCTLMGRLSAAHDLAIQARDGYLGLDDPVGLGSAYGVLSAYYCAVARFEDALAANRRALEIFPADAAQDRADAHGDAAIALYHLGRFDEARQALLRCLDVYESSGDLRSVGLVHAHLGEIARLQGNWAEALEQYRKAATRAGDSRVFTGTSRAGQGHALLGLGRVAEAQAAFDTALEIALEAGSRDDEWEARGGRARALLAAGRPDAAMAEVRRTAQLIAEMAAGLGEDHGIGAYERRLAPFDTGLQAALASGHVEDVAEFLELGRVARLLGSLASRFSARNARLPAVLVSEQDAARSDLAAAGARLQALVSTGVRGEELKTARKHLADARTRWEAVVAKVQAESTLLSEAAFPRPATLGELKASLWTGEALLLYGVLEEETVALLVTPEDARVARLGPTAALREAIQGLRGAGTAGEGGEGALAKAADLLLGKVGLPAGLQTLLVSPHVDLALVPFPALAAAAGRPGLDVALVPSGSAYRLLTAERERKGDRVLALGDPTYPRSTLARTSSLRSEELTPLPETRDEVLAVTREGDVRLLGPLATRRAFREALAQHGGRWRAIHIACHGLLDPTTTYLCELAVTPEGEADDGRIRADDIYATPIPADLVVLSACRSGEGKVRGGEGVIGFIRAFLAAGAPRVIVSLWGVDDAATRALMTKLYEGLSAGIPTARALREAQAHVRARPGWSHPRYWAAWVLWGLAD